MARPPDMSPRPPDVSAGRVVRGTFWAAIDNWIQQATQLVTFLVLGRIVGPEMFGVMALALLYVLLVQNLLVNGLSEAVIQHAEIEREHLEAVFWTLAGLGLLVAGLSWLGADLLAWLFDEPILGPVLRWLCPIFVLFGPTSTFHCKLRRDFDFRALATCSAIAYGASSVLAVVLALKGYGIWSLVAYQLAIRGLDFITALVLCRWFPRRALSFRHLRELAAFGINNTGFRFTNFLSNQIERILIGYFLGATALGLYGMARRVVDGGLFALTGVVNMVALSAFARFQNRRDRLEGLLNQASYVGSLITLPAFVGLFMVAPELVATLLDERWQGMVPVLQILCLYGILQSETFFLGSLLRAIGRADKVLRFSLIASLVRAGLCLAVIGRGIDAVALALVVASLVMLPVLFAQVRREITIAALPYLTKFLAPIAATSAMALSMWGVDLLLAGHVGGGTGLVILILAGATSYMLTLALAAGRRILAIVRQARAG